MYRLLLGLPVLFCVSCQQSSETSITTDENPQVAVIEDHEEPSVEALIQLGIPATVKQADGKILPVDEGVNSPEFNAFRSQFLQAIAARDTSFLMRLIENDSKISFGGEGGKDGFRVMWGLGEQYAQSELWGILDQLLRMGGQFAQDDASLFIAPYTYSAWPDEYDAFAYAVVTGSDVRVRVDPDVTSDALTTLSYDIVGYGFERTAEPDTIQDMVYPWHKITLSDQKEGWIYGRFLRSPIDFRMGLRHGKDTWKITFLVAGD